MAVDRPVTMYMFYFAVILLGAVSLRELSVDLLPDISYPRLSVIKDFFYPFSQRDYRYIWIFRIL